MTCPDCGKCGKKESAWIITVDCGLICADCFNALPRVQEYRHGKQTENHWSRHFSGNPIMQE